MRKLLCKIGFHYWKLLGFANLMLSDTWEICRVCGVGRMMVGFGQGEIRYSKEQMAACRAEATDFLENKLPY